MQKNFMNAVRVSNPNSNVFDLSHDVKLSFDMGYLIPSQPIEVLPGDRLTLGTQSLIRFAPLVAPVMHRFDVRHEYFFVPTRILWKNWEKFITQTEVAGNIPTHPFTWLANHFAKMSNYPLLNYMGLPYNNDPDGSQYEKISVVPMAAYQLIWDTYYRDQNLQASIQPESGFLLEDGDATNWEMLYTLRKRCWERDYFTSCLPDAQKGDPVMIPIGSQQVILNPNFTPGVEPILRDAADYSTPRANSTLDTAAGGELVGTNATPSSQSVVLDPMGSLVTEDSGEATSINDLRLAYALQRLKEKLMRGGSRLTEFLRVVFGVTPQDARLDRPEYITGIKTPVVVSEVLNTTGTEDLPQGNMAGHGVGVAGGKYGSYYAQEHGYVICLTSVLPRTAYQQGINKTWLRTEDPTDYYVPDMAHIGEQEVQNRELFAFRATEELSKGTFGYMPRFAEYRTLPSIVCGDFRDTLDHWHDSRIFATPPALNAAFVESNPDNRIFAVVEGNNKLYGHIYHDIKVSRKMPKFGTPTY